MSQELTDHLQTNIQLSEEDALRISARFKVLKVKKKFILLDEGASYHHRSNAKLVVCSVPFSFKKYKRKHPFETK